MDLKLSRKYKMSKKLRSEAFWEVFLAKELATREEVAVKVDSNRARYLQLICNTHLEKSKSARANLLLLFQKEEKPKAEKVVSKMGVDKRTGARAYVGAGE